MITRKALTLADVQAIAAGAEAEAKKQILEVKDAQGETGIRTATIGEDLAHSADAWKERRAAYSGAPFLLAVYFV